MKVRCLPGIALSSVCFAMAAAASPGPATLATVTAIPGPIDKAYPGEIRLSVDATDLARHVLRVHERISGVAPGLTLLYPKWLPGTHGPRGAIDRVAGIEFHADGVALAWTRDPTDVFAFRPQLPAGVHSLDVDFTYLSPTSSKVGGIESSPDLLRLEWIAVVLYPAGYFTRQIPVIADALLPAGWQVASAMEAASTDGARTTFRRVGLETLADSPILAGRYAQRFDLDPGAAVPVRMDVFADRPDLLNLKPENLEKFRALVQQAYRLFGSHHYAHYDFLYALSDQVGHIGLEHMESSEDGSEPRAFVDWDKHAAGRTLLPHEFTHSWDGKFRRPADLWTPNFNVPMQNSLLWVYEGQTRYWGEVLAARSGLLAAQQSLDRLADTAALYEHQSGRRWRPLEDTTNDEIMNSRRPMSWRDWQRFEDYYVEGSLIWLDADTLIRERSEGRRSLDDFARAFFGVDNGSTTITTYTFDDVVKTLNRVEPYDWAAFLRERLDESGRPAPLEGLHRGGYHLVYTDTPSDYQKTADEQGKQTDLLFSAGLRIDEKGKSIAAVLWDGAAAHAGLTEGMEIVAVNGVAYSPQALKDAIAAAKGASEPIELIVKFNERYRVVPLDYHDGLRYPHLERDAAGTARLDDILAARR